MSSGQVALGCRRPAWLDRRRGTGGNFRLVQRLFSQIARVLAINQLQTITIEVVEMARESLVSGL